jgi:hypothetical protein
LLAGTELACDGQMFFIWLRKMLDNSNWIKFEHIQSFFTEKVIANPRLVHQTTTACFSCISHMFLIVNDFQGLLDITT